jgi:hypothetical protein
METDLERQLEIAIFVRDCPNERLIAWIESAIGPLGEPEPAGEAVVYPSLLGPVILTAGIEGGLFVSIWFNTPQSPWATDVDCGRQAARELGCTVRCSPGENFPEVHPASPVFLEIECGAERLVVWE